MSRQRRAHVRRDSPCLHPRRVWPCCPRRARLSDLGRLGRTLLGTVSRGGEQIACSPGASSLLRGSSLTSLQCLDVASREIVPAGNPSRNFDRMSSSHRGQYTPNEYVVLSSGHGGEHVGQTTVLLRSPGPDRRPYQGCNRGGDDPDPEASHTVPFGVFATGSAISDKQRKLLTWMHGRGAVHFEQLCVLFRQTRFSSQTSFVISPHARNLNFERPGLGCWTIASFAAARSRYDVYCQDK